MVDYREITIDDCIYEVEVYRRLSLQETATRIIVPTYMMSDTARDMVRVCIESLLRFTEEEIEIWVVDNHSARSHADWLIAFDGPINVALNRTEPINPLRKPPNFRRKLRRLLTGQPIAGQMQDGAYANAVGLEIGRQCIDASVHTIFTMHYDTLATREGWLRYLKSKLTGKVRAVAIHHDPGKIQAYHIAGLLFDYRLFDELEMSFMPNMNHERHPDLPEYDVGDRITLQLHAHGHSGFVLPNTHNDPSLIELIPADSPFRNLATSARCFDDHWNVIFLHMGRGTVKSIGKYKQKNKLYPEQWIEFAEKHLLS